MKLDSVQNPKIKRLVALRKRRDRDDERVMLVEGHDELAAALAYGVKPLELYYAPALMGQVDSELLRRVAEMGAELWELSGAAFEKAAYREGPDGWLAVVPAVQTALAAVRLGEAPLVLVAEAMEKPGNLGAMLRTAVAVGADAVISAAPVTDLANPNVVRASKGAVFGVPVAEASTAEVVAWLSEHDLRLVAADPRAGKRLWDVDMASGVAIAVGTEHNGLSNELRQAAAELVEIPMQGSIDSLNAATSAALLLYEALRQRSQS